GSMPDRAEPAIFPRSWQISMRSKRAGGAVTTGVPRRCNIMFGKMLGWVSAGLFDPEFAPTFWADIAVNKGASVRLLEQRAIAALLIIFRRILVRHRFLIHLCRCLL